MLCGLFFDGFGQMIWVKYKIKLLQDYILRYSDICGMDFDFVCILTCIRDMILTFDFSGFTNKGRISPKAHHTLLSVFLVKLSKT